MCILLPSLTQFIRRLVDSRTEIEMLDFKFQDLTIGKDVASVEAIFMPHIDLVPRLLSK